MKRKLNFAEACRKVAFFTNYRTSLIVLLHKINYLIVGYIAAVVKQRN